MRRRGSCTSAFFAPLSRIGEARVLASGTIGEPSLLSQTPCVHTHTRHSAPPSRNRCLDRRRLACGYLYSDFFKTGGVPACPDEVVTAVEDKVAEHLERLGKGALSFARTAKATLGAITEFHGVELMGTRTEAFEIVVNEIVKVSRQYS